MKRAELTGKRFGRLLVIKSGGATSGPSRWECLCDCGTIKILPTRELGNRGTRSCGCLRDEKIGSLNRTHGKSKGCSEFYSWTGMKRRCINELDPKYKNYGGRGILVCERWINSFENFFSDMGEKPSKIHTIDRINVNGNYEPSNCRWATPLEQARNKQITKFVWYKGSLRVLREVCDELGIHFQKVRGRKDYRGITFQEAFDTYVLPKSTLVNHSFGYVN